MANGATAPVDQRALDRYQNDFYVHSDLVYRFGVVLTGSREGAERLTEETYRSLIDDFGKVKANANPVDMLMVLAWQAWNRIKSERFHEWSHPTLNALRKLSTDERASLYVIDMVGISPKDAARLFGSNERAVRMSLASARRRLVSGEISL